MGKRNPSHRCPECRQTFYSGESVTLHRADKQGKCFDHLPRHMKAIIERYRVEFAITPPPLPPTDDFDVIDDEPYPTEEHLL